jgi:hypothetical protein
VSSGAGNGQRVWSKGARGGADLLWDENDPYIWVLVTGKERFKYPQQEEPQDYALAITFEYQSDLDIDLYVKLKEKSHIKQRESIRTRTRTTIQR